MEYKKNTNPEGTKYNFGDRPIDGTEVFKTSEVTKIIDEAIEIIEERWSKKAVTRKIPDCRELKKMYAEEKKAGKAEKSEKNQQSHEIDKSDKDWIYKEIVRLESEGKWRELEQFTKSEEFLECEPKGKDWQQQREEYLMRSQALQSENSDTSEENSTLEDNKECKNYEHAESDEEKEESDETEDTEDIKDAKKRKKTDTQSMVKRLKIALIVTGLLFAALIAGRIIYVNCTYPSTKIKMLNQNDKLTGENCYMTVNSAVIYSKEKWVDYLKKNVPKDEDFDADRYASIPGAGENYDIVCVELSVSNTSGETMKISGIRMGLVLHSGYHSQGYSIFIREKTDNSQLIKNYEIEAGNTRKFVFAYTLEEEFKKNLMLQYCELGNNQRMVLELEEVQ